MPFELTDAEFMAQMQVEFRVEVLDLLIELDSALLALESEAGDSTRVNRVFRAIHTIKGTGASVGLAHLAQFTHRIEEVFILARDGRLPVTPELIDSALKACDVIKRIVGEQAEGPAVPGEEELADAFTRLLPAPDTVPDEEAKPGDEVREIPENASADPLGAVPAETFEVFAAECGERLEEIERDALALERNPSSREDLDSLFRGVHTVKGNAGLLLGHAKGTAPAAGHPLQLLQQVAHALESLLDPFRGMTAGRLPGKTIRTALGTCDAMRSLLAGIKGNSADKDANSLVAPGLLERLGLRTGATAVSPAPVGGGGDGRDAVFLNTTSQCVEMILGCFRRLENSGDPPGPVLETYMRGLKTMSAAARYRHCPELEELVAQQLRILEAAVKAGAGLRNEETAALSHAFFTTRSVLSGMSSEGAIPSPAETPARRVEDTGPLTVRIDQNKLDRLMTVVGELLVARGAFPLLVQKVNEGADGTAVVKDLKEAGSNISRIADELQRSVMSIRMLPVKTVFQRFPRLVRDLARSLGKEVQLVIEGEGIELDKTILEQIGDPLVHLIRNAVDHGLEPPAERRAKGKEASGRLTLRAVREAGGVTIEVTEDGRGLDAEALKRKAMEKGLLTPEAAAGMSEAAAFQLIFLPGLSTAAKVTDTSGRGVGMDVVRSNVGNLHGAIEIRSKSGEGTTLLIKLPTSLMVSKGILMEAGGQQYILPLSNIRDMIKLPRKETHEYRGCTLAQIRGTIYSLFSLAEMLDLKRVDRPELSVAVVEAGTARYGLVVDRFLTEAEVLVKPLGGGLEQCREFQGAAIMGDGRVVLVLNALECHRLNRTAQA